MSAPPSGCRERTNAWRLSILNLVTSPEMVSVKDVPPVESDASTIVMEGIAFYKKQSASVVTLRV